MVELLEEGESVLLPSVETESHLKGLSVKEAKELQERIGLNERIDLNAVQKAVSKDQATVANKDPPTLSVVDEANDAFPTTTEAPSPLHVEKENSVAGSKTPCLFNTHRIKRIDTNRVFYILSILHFTKPQRQRPC